MIVPPPAFAKALTSLLISFLAFSRSRKLSQDLKSTYTLSSAWLSTSDFKSSRVQSQGSFAIEMADSMRFHNRFPPRDGAASCGFSAKPDSAPSETLEGGRLHVDGR